MHRRQVPVRRDGETDESISDWEATGYRFLPVEMLVLGVIAIEISEHDDSSVVSSLVRDVIGLPSHIIHGLSYLPDLAAFRIYDTGRPNFELFATQYHGLGVGLDGRGRNESELSDENEEKRKKGGKAHDDDVGSGGWSLERNKETL